MAGEISLDDLDDFSDLIAEEGAGEELSPREKMKAEFEETKALIRQVAEHLDELGEEELLAYNQMLEDAERIACELSLAVFFRCAWHTIDPAPYQHNWHIDITAEAAERLITGESRNLIVNQPPRTSKPVSEEAFVLEKKKGRVRLKEITEGDFILTHKGRYRKVKAVYRQGVLPLVRVETYFGRALETASDHPYLTTRGWVNAGDLTLKDVLANVKPVESCGGLALSPEEARFLGYMAGDGSCKSSTTGFTNMNEAVLADFERCCAVLGFATRRKVKAKCRATHIYVTNGLGKRVPRDKSHLAALLKKHDYFKKGSYEKKVPGAVFAGNDEVVRNFISAYYSCDGHISVRDLKKKGVREDFSLGLNSVNRELLVGVQHLLLRLGINARLRKKTAAFKTRRQGDIYTSWALELASMDEVARFARAVPVVHSEKRIKLTLTRRTKFDDVLGEDPVAGVAESGEGFCRCLEVEEDHSFVANDLAVHNSNLLTVCVPAWIWCQSIKGPMAGPQVKFMAASYSQALSFQHSTLGRNLIQSPWYQKHWGKRFTLRDDRNAVGFFENDKGGYRMATSVGAAITGFGADCVAEGTLVATPRGDVKIEDLRVGDDIFCFDHSNGMAVASRILAKAGRMDVERYEISAGGLDLCVTANHPVFVLGQGYVAARDLDIGDRVVSFWRKQNTAVWDLSIVTGIRCVSGEAKQFYDIQVEKFCNFFAGGLLVHNCLIVDDPHNTQEVESEATRTATINWYAQSLSTRLNDMRTGVKMLVMQRQQEEDLTGYLLSTEPEAWDHVVFRMRYEANPFLPYDPRGTDENGEQLYGLDAKGEVIPGSPLAEAVGTLLWPSRMPEGPVASLEKTLGTYGCTPAGSPVLMADLSDKPIEQVRPGDEIMGFSVDTESKHEGEVCSRRKLKVATVKNVFKYENAEIVKLVFASGRTARCTRDHKWYMGRGGSVESNGHFRPLYRPAAEGDRLICVCAARSLGEEKEEVVAIVPDGQEDVYALETTTGNYVVWGLASSNSAGQFQQRPSPKGGGIIKAGDWQIFPPAGQEEAWKKDGVVCWPPFEFVVGSLDTSSTENESNDPCAFTIWGVWYDHTGFPRVVVVHAWEAFLSFNKLVMRVGNNCRKFQPDVLLIEAKANGISVAQEIQRVFTDAKWSTVLVTPKGDKVARAISVQGIWEDQMVYAPDREWAQLLIDRCAQFPKGKRKDLVDTATQAVRWLRDNGLLARRGEVIRHREEAIPQSGQTQAELPPYDV